MREGSDFDEIDEDVKNRLFSLDEILSESEVEEVESGEKTISKEERDELLQEVHGSFLSESERDELVRESLRVISPKTGNDIDPEEVCKLYLEDGLSMKKVGEHFGFKTGRSIKRILESVGVQVRQSGAQGEKLDPDEVLGLYLEEGLSLRKIGEHFGFKSGKPIKRILEAEGIEIRPVGFQKIEIDSDEVYRLYFEEHWDLREIANHFGCESTDPIHRVFSEEGWKTRYQETYEKEIEPEEVFRLYDDGMSIRNIGEHYGVSYGRIHRIFEEHGKEYGREIQIDPDIIHRLYFEEGLSKDEVCERLGVSKKPIDRIFEEQEWEKRPSGFQPIEIDIDEFKRLYYKEELELDLIAECLQVSTSTVIRFREEQELEDRVLKYGKELRDEIFGTDCRLCGEPYEHVHRKDGKPHKSHILWSRKSLLKLNPDDWAALCEGCHRVTHMLMRTYGFDWNQIETKVKDMLDRMSFRERLKGALSKWF